MGCNIFRFYTGVIILMVIIICFVSSWFSWLWLWIAFNNSLINCSMVGVRLFFFFLFFFLPTWGFGFSVLPYFYIGYWFPVLPFIAISFCIYGFGFLFFPFWHGVLAILFFPSYKGSLLSCSSLHSFMTNLPFT